MMRVTTRGRYALRAMVDLVMHSSEGTVRRQSISDRQDISADYVAQLFRQLRNAGLVEAVKGPGGGYRLSRDPGRITVGDVVRAVEGPVAVVHCALPDDQAPCARVDRCVTHTLWVHLSNTIRRFLDSVTLLDLRDEALLLSALSGSGEGAVLTAASLADSAGLSSEAFGPSTSQVIVQK